MIKWILIVYRVLAIGEEVEDLLKVNKKGEPVRLPTASKQWRTFIREESG